MNEQVHLLRRQLGLSLQTLADASGLTKSYLSKIERGICVPSITAALRIAAALKVDVAQLFSPETTQNNGVVVRRDGRLRIQRDSAANGSGLEAIAAEIKQKRMLPFVVTPAPQFADGPHLSGHAGEEFLFVLEGQVEIEFPDQTELLQVGDGIYFNALRPHRLRSAGPTPASALVVISAEETKA